MPGVVTLKNGSTLKGDFYIETGARTDLDFNTPFVNDNNLKSKVGDTYSYLVTGLSDHESVHTRGQVDQFDVAGFTFSDLPVGLSQESAGIQADGEMAGIIGNEILHRFNIVYNYKARKMWLSKNSNMKVHFSSTPPASYCNLTNLFQRFWYIRYFPDQLLMNQEYWWMMKLLRLMGKVPLN